MKTALRILDRFLEMFTVALGLTFILDATFRDASWARAMPQLIQLLAGFWCLLAVGYGVLNRLSKTDTISEEER